MEKTLGMLATFDFSLLMHSLIIKVTTGQLLNKIYFVVMQEKINHKNFPNLIIGILIENYNSFKRKGLNILTNIWFFSPFSSQKNLLL